MMLLDVGNSSVKWAFCRESRLAERGRFRHIGKDFSHLASVAWVHLPEPTAVAVANVAGRGMEQEITDWTRKKWNITPRYLRATVTAAGVQNAYAEPEKMVAYDSPTQTLPLSFRHNAGTENEGPADGYDRF